ncbi:MAG: GNAT family N-acetyltransferase [Acidimicrobiales bacterium]
MSEEHGTRLDVDVATDVTDELAAEVARLVPQVSTSARPPTRADIEEIVHSPGATLFVARDREQGTLVGMLTLITYRIPTGVHAVIEDVVVDAKARGGGIGAALVTAALEEAARRGSRNVDLTSRATREAANRLYQRLGFVVRETNVYRYSMQ